MYDLRKPNKYSEQYTLTGYCAKDHGKHETQLTNHPLALPRPTSSAAEHRKAQRPRSPLCTSLHTARSVVRSSASKSAGPGRERPGIEKSTIVN